VGTIPIRPATDANVIGSIDPNHRRVIIWDIETIPDLQGFTAANYLIGKTDDEIREMCVTEGGGN